MNTKKNLSSEEFEKLLSSFNSVDEIKKHFSKVKNGKATYQATSKYIKHFCANLNCEHYTKILPYLANVTVRLFYNKKTNNYEVIAVYSTSKLAIAIETEYNKYQREICARTFSYEHIEKLEEKCTDNIFDSIMFVQELLTLLHFNEREEEEGNDYEDED